MKKIDFSLAKPIASIASKLLLAMKITTALLLLSLHVAAGGFSQTLTIEANNMPVAKVFRDIEKQSNYRFVYNNELLSDSKLVTINIRQTEFHQALEKLFRYLKLGYKVLPERVVVVTPQPLAGVDDPVSLPPGTVRGKVTDESGNPLEGASVSVKGRTTGVITDRDGNFVLSLDPGSYTLQISYAGYDVVTQSVTISDNEDKNITASLTPRKSSMDEVVVIGYGDLSRRKLSSSVAKIEGSAVARQRISTVGEGLAGQVAGVQVQLNSGQPGNPPVIRIRGVRTFGDGSPLYVVDNYPLPDPVQFNAINPNDIESIEILKDAAAASIYGSRGANGVVIVTTKKGRMGKTQFSLNVNGGVSQISKKVELLTPQEYVDFARQGQKLFGTLGVYPAILDDPSRLSNTDWQDAIFRNARFSDYQISASGGNERSHYFVSGGVLDQQGTLLGTSFKRYNLRFNFDTRVVDKVKVGIDFAPSYSQQFVHASAGAPTGDGGFLDDGSFLVRGQPGAVYTALLMAPVFPVRNANGSYFEVEFDPTGFGQYNKYQANFINPVAQLELTQHRRRNYRALTMAYLEYEPIKNLKLLTRGGSSFDLTDQYDYYNPYWDRGGPLNTVVAPGQPFANEGQRRSVDLLWENVVTYSRNFGSHNLSAAAFHSLQDNTNKYTGVYGRDGAYTQLSLTNPYGAFPNFQGELSFTRFNFYSIGGRLNYDYKGRYLFTASVRQDGSSKFGPNKRSAVFPAFSLGWNIAEENFMKTTRATVTDLKLRASYGFSGSSNIGAFSWTAGSVGNTQYVFNNNVVGGSLFNGITNADLTWERLQQLNLGVDAAFFRNKLTLSVEWYRTKNKDFHFFREVPGTYGTGTSVLTNAGEIENKGLEIQLGTNLSFGKLRWSASLNLGTYENKVVSLVDGRPELPYGGSVFGWNDVYRIKVGRSLGELYGYKVNGVFRSAADLNGNPQWAAGGSKLGDFIIDDFNKDGKIDFNDMQPLGNAFPGYTFGISNNFEFNGFDLSVLIQGAQDVHLINGTNRFLYQGFGNYNQRKDFYNNWFDPSKPDRDVRYQRLAAGGTSPYPVNALTDRGGLEDGSFVRVRNVTFGYTFPARWINRVKLKSARLYFSGQNLFTWTKYSGYNPEVSRQYASNVQPGIDMGAYPLSRIYTFGLNVGF